MAVKVISPGLATSVQDLGRQGYYHLGIPISGGMDRFSLRAANRLVGNDEGAAVLEAVFMGPELEFTSDATVAVAGAELPPKVDGEPRETWTSFAVKAGQTLSFDFLKAGARAYIAVSGGIDVPLALGSRSTYTLGALGGPELNAWMVAKGWARADPATGARFRGDEAGARATRRGLWSGRFVAPWDWRRGLRLSD